MLLKKLNFEEWNEKSNMKNAWQHKGFALAIFFFSGMFYGVIQIIMYVHNDVFQSAYQQRKRALRQHFWQR